MGVDGFRCDVINLISKDQRFKNGLNPLILTGKKEEQKYFKRYSGFQSGLHLTQYKKMMAEHSDVALMRAIKGMLPKNSLGRAMATHCHIYKGAEHNHAAQKPEVLKLD